MALFLEVDCKSDLRQNFLLQAREDQMHYIRFVGENQSSQVDMESFHLQ